MGVITPKNLVVNQERAAAYCGYVLCGVHDRRIEHDIRCASDIAAHNPKESPRGRIYATGNCIEPAPGTTALCSQLLCCVLLEFSWRLNRPLFPSIGGKENWKLFLVVRGGEKVASSVSEKQKLEAVKSNGLCSRLEYVGN